MFLCIFCLGKPTGRFNYDLGAHGFPGDKRGVSLRKNLEFFALHLDSVCRRRDLMVEISQHRIVLQQMRQRSRISYVIDGDEVYVFVAERCAKDVAADTTEPIDADLNCHSLSPYRRRFLTAKLPSIVRLAGTFLAGKPLERERLTDSIAF